jgi:hypothetical protein
MLATFSPQAAARRRIDVPVEPSSLTSASAASRMRRRCSDSLARDPASERVVTVPARG